MTSTEAWRTNIGVPHVQMQPCSAKPKILDGKASNYRPSFLYSTAYNMIYNVIYDSFSSFLHSLFKVFSAQPQTHYLN